MLQQTVQLATRIREEILSRKKETLSRQSGKVEGKNVFRDIFRVCCDTEFNLSSANQPDCVATEENYVVTKDEEEITEDWSRQRKVCRDSFQKHKSMRSWLQQILCHDTRHSCCNKNKTVASKYVVTLLKSVAIESKKKLRKPILIEIVGYDIS